MEKKSKPKIKVLVLDLLKPHQPNIAEFGQALCEVKSVQNANLSVYAIDEKTESIKAVLEGTEIDFEEVKKKIEDFGAVVHSVDKAVVGAKKIIEAPSLPDHLSSK
ncbi:DUF211 domain-containing protein [Candidatus Micrarchaeota archaeon]|nr:DUF211 domain-containing protein [Candidatus Micrarchaeota archaeon]MBU1929880.1 DUF211 domain-containing protein [Candidatus Micrarchaeota archaeon]